MKKNLSILCVMTMLVVSLLAVSVPVSAASRTKADWKTTGSVTFNADGTMAIPNGSFATLNQVIDFTDENLDVSVKVTAPLNKPAQYIKIYLSKTIPTTMDAGADVFHAQFNLDNEKYGLHYTDVGADIHGTAFAGGQIPLSNGSVTIRFKRGDDKLIHMYMDSVEPYYDVSFATTVSDFIKGLETGYLTIGVLCYDEAITATVLEVNGMAPLYESPRTAADWTLNNSASFNADGTLAIPNGSFATLKQAIDFTDENLDVSVKVTAPLNKPAQYIRIFLSKTIPTTMDAGADVFHAQFNLDNEKYGLHYTDVGADIHGTAFSGGQIPLSNGSVTIRFKRGDDNLIHMYMDSAEPYYQLDFATTVSNFIKGLGTGYLTIGVLCYDEAITATVLEVNGMAPVVKNEAPITYGTAGILDELVDEKQGLRFNYTLTTAVSGDAETVTVNGTTYTVSKIGMLVSKNVGASLVVGATGVAQGHVTKARSIDTSVDGQVTYTFSILVKNIDKDNKATDIYARPYLECADGTILYGKTQVTNVQEMYTELSKTTTFDDVIVTWMQ